MTIKINNNYNKNINTFSGIVCLSDFGNYTSIADMGNKILDALEFDFECQEKVKNRKTRGTNNEKY